jgi:hypothetical protein
MELMGACRDYTKAPKNVCPNCTLQFIYQVIKMKLQLQSEKLQKRLLRRTEHSHYTGSYLTRSTDMAQISLALETDMTWAYNQYQTFIFHKQDRNASFTLAAMTFSIRNLIH